MQAPPNRQLPVAGASQSLTSLDSGYFICVLLFVRVLLPLGLLIAGIVLLAVPETWGIGLGFVGLAAIAWLTNFLIRLTVSSQDDRDREEQARKRFARTGRWSSR